jgi:EAL domain-containing protein (putative c-di-GMP-specific phosphodiesterase class I)
MQTPESMPAEPPGRLAAPAAADQPDAELVRDLELALEHDELVLHFQPEIDLASGAVVAMEALLRWRHPGRGLLWPRDVLPVAAAGRLDSALGAWVLRHCVTEAAAWRELPGAVAGEPRQMWANVSAAQLLEPGFVEEVGAAVAAAELAPGTLGLEVTEEAIERAGSGALTLFTSLRDAGVALAVDDFGTWYSSLATLGELPFDAVKLDRTFVRGVGSDLEDDTIVASVVRLAHAHGLYVVAEGVESWAEGARLCELGCDRAHGYLFSGPQEPARARMMLVRGLGWTTPTGQGMPGPRTADAAVTQHA